MKLNHIYQGNNIDVLKTFPAESVDCVVTSPPYWGLRDYNQEDQLGLEETPEEFVENLVKVFSEVKRVLKSTGTLWLNLGDSYAMSSMRGKNSEFKGMIDQSKQGIVGVNKKIPQGLKAKDLVGIPFRVAFALQADGWYLRQDIIWNKPNPMPESVQDRCTKAHEYIFLLSKSSKYFYDIDAIREPFNEGGLKRINQVNLKNQKGSTRGNGGMRKNGNMKAVGNIEKGKNKRSVWTITTKPYKEAHFATFPIELPTYCIKAGCPEGGIVLDPFMGSGTTGLAAQEQGRNYVGIDLNPEYIEIAERRLQQMNLFI
jgi:DNA modification methylase